MSITNRAWFCKWCIDNYVCTCACSVASLLHDPSSMTSDGLHHVVYLQNAVSEIVKWRLDKSLKQSLFRMLGAQWIAMLALSLTTPTLRPYLCWMYVTAKAEQVQRVYFTAVVCLHGAHKTMRGSLTDEMLDILATTCLQSNNLRRCLNARQSSVLSLSQAAMLMKVVASNSRSTMQLIEIELAKAYLYRALAYKDSDSDSIYCLANVYLAVLYYTTGHCQTAIDHCTLVTRSQDHPQCSSHVVQGEVLPKVDDDIDTVLGLAVFY